MKHRVNILLYALSIALISFFLRDSDYFIPLLILVTLVSFTILSLGVLFMQFNYFLRSITRLKNEHCLLTFDDGPDPQKTIQILDILLKHEIKAVFFTIAKRAEDHPEIIQRIVKEGHLIGNHSYDHNNFMSMYSKNKLRKELNKAQEALTKVTGQKISLFRPPIGYTNPNYASVLKELQLKCIGWTLRSYDSVYKNEEKLKERLIKLTKPGQIVLLHDNLEVTANSLEEYIIAAKGNGIIFASEANINTVLND